MKHLGSRFKTLALSLLLSCGASPVRAEIIISHVEMEEICASQEAYASLDCKVAGDIIQTIKKIQAITPEECWSPEFCILCKRLDAGYTTAPQAMLEKALECAYEALEKNHRSISNDCDAADMLACLSDCYAKMMQGTITITRNNNDERAPRPNPVLPQDDSIDPQALLNLPRDLNIERDGQFGGNLQVHGNATIDGDLGVGGNTNLAGDLTVGGDVVIDGGLTVIGPVIIPAPVFVGDVVIQATAGNNGVCVIFEEDDGDEKARLCSTNIENDKGLYISVDAGVTQNFRVNNEGGVIIDPTAATAALTVNGFPGSAAVMVNPGSPGIIIGDSGADAELRFSGASAIVNAQGSLDFTYGAAPGTEALQIQADGVVNIADGAGAFLVPSLTDRLTVNGDLTVSGTVTGGTGLVATTGGLTVSAGGINSTGTTQLNSLTTGVMQTNGAGVVSSTSGTNGQLLIGATGLAPAWANITAGTGIVVTNGANSITLATSGATANSFPTDSGTATPAAGALTIAGGSNINTSGAGSTVTVNLDNTVSVSGSISAGTQFLAADGSLPTPSYSFTTDTGSGIGMFRISENAIGFNTRSAGVPRFTIGNDVDGLNNPTNTRLSMLASAPNLAIISISSAGANIISDNALTLQTTLATDINLVPGSGTVQITGSINATGTVTGGTGLVATTGGLTVSAGGINSTGTTQLNSLTTGVMQTNGAGVVSSTSGTDGQLLIGATGGAPAWANLTAGTGIVVTNGANSITLATSGATANSFPTDSGTATPAAGALTIAGGSNINTSGAGSTVTVNLDNTVSVSGSISAGTQFLAADGSLPTPSYSFTTDTGSGIGMFRISENAIGFNTRSAGVPRFTIGNDVDGLNNPTNTRLSMSASAPNLAIISISSAGANIISDNALTLQTTLATDINLVPGSGTVEVSGIIRAGNGSATSPTYSFANLGDEDNGMYLSSPNTLAFSTAGAPRVTIGSVGEVTINTPTAPATALDVNGEDGSTALIVHAGSPAHTVIHLGDTTAAVGSLLSLFMYNLPTTALTDTLSINAGNQVTRVVSSKRYKKNITDMEVDSSAIYAMRPVSYEMINQDDNKRHIGFIAEELHEVCPALVTYMSKKSLGLDESEELVPNGVAYQLISVLLVKEMQNMKAINDAQQAQIAMLTQKLDEVLARIS